MTSHFTLKPRSSSRSLVWSFPPLLKPLRTIVDQVEVKDRQWAHCLCRLIPGQCPFERDLSLWGHHLFHIPPLCHINPLYNELMALRFRALTYLAEECQEDISCYLQG